MSDEQAQTLSDRRDAIRRAAQVEQQRRQNKRAQAARDMPMRDDVRKPWACTEEGGIVPNDRERELALRVFERSNRGGFSHAELIISISKALATYRGELLSQTDLPLSSKGLRAHDQAR